MFLLKIYQLAEKLKVLMVSEEGFDLSTAEEFVREVRSVDHPAHKSSDSGDKLPKNYIEIHRQPFLMWNFNPQGGKKWNLISMDEVSFKIRDKRIEDCNNKPNK